MLFTDHSGRYATYGDEGGYDPYCQDGSRRAANGQCQYEFVADAQTGLGGGADGMPPDPEEYWNRLIQTKPETPDPLVVFDEDKGQPGQVIFVPTDLGPGIVIQTQSDLDRLLGRETFDCPDKWLFPNLVESKRNRARPTLTNIRQVGYGSTDLSRLVIQYRQQRNIGVDKNVAVYEFIEDGQTKVLIMESNINEGSNGHSEKRISRELERRGIKPDEVTRIYSEFEPCTIPAGCKRYIAERYPFTEVTYSFEYGDADSRVRGKEAKRNAIQQLPPPPPSDDA